MEQLQTLNASLRSKGVRGRLVVVRRTLFLRGTFTATDGTRKDRKICIGLPAHPGQLLKAENRVLQLADIINSTGIVPEELPWDALAPSVVVSTATEITVADALERLEEDFWKGKVRTSAAQRTWDRLKAEVDRLPPAATLTMDLLVAVGEKQEPGSRTRQEFLKVSKRVAKLVGIEGTERLDELKTPYEPAVREVPSDQVVADLLEQVIDDPTWGWPTWAIATFGCRPAETFSLQPAEDGTAQVITVKRKGKQPYWRTALALPVYGSRAMRSVPWDVASPTQYDSITAKLYTDRWMGWLRRQHPTLQLYDLRHAWAIRSISKIPSTSIAAKCMGHDIAVHHRTYHRWLDQADIAAIAQTLQGG